MISREIHFTCGAGTTRYTSVARRRIATAFLGDVSGQKLAMYYAIDSSTSARIIVNKISGNYPCHTCTSCFGFVVAVLQLYCYV